MLASCSPVTVRKFPPFRFWLFAPCSLQLIFVLSLELSLGGCATRRPPEVTPPSSVALPSAQDLLRQLDARRQTLTRLRGLARVVYKDTQEKGTAKQAVAVAVPDRFRLELFSPIGIVALVTSNGKALASYFPKEKVLYRGLATPTNVARFTRVALSPSEIVGLLLGLPMLAPDHTGCTVRRDTEQDWFRLDCASSRTDPLSLWFEPKTLWLRRVEVLNSDRTTRQRMNLAEYREVNGQFFPFEVVLTDLQGQQEAAIYYERVELNPQLPDALFTLAPITGVQEFDADAFPSP